MVCQFVCFLQVCLIITLNSCPQLFRGFKKTKLENLTGKQEVQQAF